MRSKIISIILCLGVILALTLVPGAPAPKVALAQANEWGYEIQPNVTRVGFNEAFTVNVTLRWYAGEADAWKFYIPFDTSLLEVTDISEVSPLPTGNAPSPVPGYPKYNNTAGFLQHQSGVAGGDPNVNSTFVSCTITFSSKAVAGTAYLNFTTIDMPRSSTVILLGSDVLNWTKVVNGTVMIGTPTLKVCVNPVGNGSVEADGTPLVMTAGCNTTTRDWDNVVNLEAVNSTPGWGFANWSGDVDVPNSTSTTVTVTMDALTKNVTANFEELPPEIEVSPPSLTVPVLPNGTADASYTITNIGGGVLNWSLSNVTYVPDGNMTWFTQNPVNGTLTANVSDTVNVTANATGLAVGTYTATINITGNSSKELPVTLIVGTPEISASPTSLAFTTNEGENPSDQTLEVWNSGSGMLDWNMTDDAGWLDESPTTGNSTGESDNVTVSVDVSGMAAGDYSATITITDPLANNSPQTVSVSLHITAAAEVEIPEEPELPEIIVEPASLSASSLDITPQQVEPGQEVTISVSVANTGGKTGSYNAILYINEVVEDSQTVSVAGGTSKNVIFTVSKTKAGVYDVSVAGQSGQFEVVSTGWFGGGMGTGGIIAIVVVVIILIVAVIFIMRGTRREV